LAATFVTLAELRSTLGIGTLYSDSVVEEVCQTAQNIVSDYLWKNQQYNSSHSHIVGYGTLYFNTPHGFFVGQVVTVSGNGATFNGSKTITSLTPTSITFVTSHSTIEPIHATNPYGTVAATDYVTYSTVPEIRESSLLIAVDIWQSRQQSSAGGISPDFQPSPYRMGNTLLARVRGILANHLSPNSLVG
jgi:hypothetical protein